MLIFNVLYQSPYIAQSNIYKFEQLPLQYSTLPHIWTSFLQLNVFFRCVVIRAFLAGPPQAHDNERRYATKVFVSLCSGNHYMDVSLLRHFYCELQ